MLFADQTIIQISAESLVAGLTTFGGLVAGAIVAAAKLVSGTITKLHEENRQDRNALFQIVNQQWEQLTGIGRTTQQIKRKIDAGAGE